MKISTVSVLILFMLASCAPKTKETKVFWISGFKPTCQMGTGSANCLLISQTDDLQQDRWELFYSDIEGFNFEEGFLKKVEVLAKVQDPPVATDRSTMHYTLVKELDKTQDRRALLAGEWQLGTITSETEGRDSLVQTLGIDLKEMKIYGDAGCNTFNGTIEKLGQKTVSFGSLLNTLRTCELQSAEDKYLGAIRDITAFDLDNDKLHLIGENGKIKLTFSKMAKTKNTLRIHDIWSAVRIVGNPINRMVTVPRLEINTTEMKVYGNDGCNAYFGTITNLSENNFSLGNIGSTKKMCQDMEIPQHFNATLSKVRTYKFEKQILILGDEKGDEVLAFIKTD